MCELHLESNVILLDAFIYIVLMQMQLVYNEIYNVFFYMKHVSLTAFAIKLLAIIIKENKFT